MKKYLLSCILVCYIWIANAQLGIGTQTPSPNAILDLTSTDKGLMLPRIADTGMVINPGAGLLIYNRNSNTPAFHNGTNWRNLSSSTFNSDSITYTVTGGNASNGFTNGTYPLHSIENGITDDVTSPPSFQTILFSKKMDINSIAFIRATAFGSGTSYSGLVFEFRFYTPGATTPYYSIKASSLKVMGSVRVSNAQSASFLENLGIIPNIYGYKDWVNNLSFAWNTLTANAVTY